MFVRVARLKLATNEDLKYQTRYRYIAKALNAPALSTMILVNAGVIKCQNPQQNFQNMLYDLREVLKVLDSVENLPKNSKADLILTHTSKNIGNTRDYGHLILAILNKDIVGYKTHRDLRAIALSQDNFDKWSSMNPQQLKQKTESERSTAKRRVGRFVRAN